MGVIKRGILGGFSGKVANVIGSSWKGIAVMKSMPLSVANPNTAAQVVQRTRMTNAVEFAKACLVEAIKPLNDRFASGMSGFNLFIQRNIALFDLPVVSNNSLLVLASGSVTIFDSNSIVSSAGAGTLTITPNDNTGDGNALGTDELYFVAQETETGYVGAGSGGTRAGGAYVYDLPAAFSAGNHMDIYICYRRADGTQVSNTWATNAIIGA